MRKLILCLFLLMLLGCNSENFLGDYIEELQNNPNEISIASEYDGNKYNLSDTTLLVTLLQQIDETKTIDSVLLESPSDIITYNKNGKENILEIYAINELDEENNPIETHYIIGLGKEKSLGYTYKYYKIDAKLHQDFIDLINSTKDNSQNYQKIASIDNEAYSLSIFVSSPKFI